MGEKACQSESSDMQPSYGFPCREVRVEQFSYSQIQSRLHYAFIVVIDIKLAVSEVVQANKLQHH